MIGGFHAQAIAAMSNGNLGGVADQAPERARAFGTQYDGKAYESVDAMLADPSIDVVTIGTPSGAHFSPAMAAIQAGKHVIIEKPIEITTERIDLLMAAAQEKGVTLAAVLNRRFHPAMDLFQQAVAQGRLGRLTSASAYVKWYRNQAYYDSAQWRGTWALDGGGALMNQSIHTIDTLLHLAGPVKSVQAQAACLAHERIEVEDTLVALLEFASGARGTVECSTCCWAKTGHPARVQLAGMEGSIFLADEAFEVWEFLHEAPEDEQVRAQYMGGHAVGLGAKDPGSIDFRQHQRNFEQIVSSIEAGREPPTSAREARKSVELIEAIYRSAQNDGRRIMVGE